MRGGRRRGRAGAPAPTGPQRPAARPRRDAALRAREAPSDAPPGSSAALGHRRAGPGGSEERKGGGRRASDPGVVALVRCPGGVESVLGIVPASCRGEHLRVRGATGAVERQDRAVAGVLVDEHAPLGRALPVAGTRGRRRSCCNTPRRACAGCESLPRWQPPSPPRDGRALRRSRRRRSPPVRGRKARRPRGRDRRRHARARAPSGHLRATPRRRRDGRAPRRPNRRRRSSYFPRAPGRRVRASRSRAMPSRRSGTGATPTPRVERRGRRPRHP